MIEVQDRIEYQEITSLRFGAPERVVGKEHDVSFPERGIDHGCVLREFASLIQKTGHQKLVCIRVAQYDARALAGRDHVDRISKLFPGQRSCFPYLGFRLFGYVYRRTALGHIGIIGCAASGWPFIGLWSAAPPASTDDIRHVEYGRVGREDREIIPISVEDRTGAVDCFGT